MKIKQAGAVQAYKVFEKLAKQPMNSNLAYKIFKLKKELKDSWDFQLERENEIIKQYNGKPNNDGTVTFEGENLEKATEELKKLSELEVNVMDVSIDILSENIQISPEDIEDIQPFILM